MATAIDPICQMDVDTENPPGGQSEHEGTTYYFCAPGCKVAFDKEPEKYVSEAHGHDDHEGHDHGAHDEHESHDDHQGHDHAHGAGGHTHGHHMPEKGPESAPAANKPGFFARLFGKK
ncbi:MAG: YHS domain-containing protein [Chloroflexi bacterium]|nr:YHS domain-containing protein [Chloroflexota bacterium]